MRWAECLPSSLSIDWERDVKHSEMVFMSRRLTQICAYAQWISYIWRRDGLCGAGNLALSYLLKATFGDQERKMPLLGEMGMSFPFAVVVLVQRQCFSPGLLMLWSTDIASVQYGAWAFLHENDGIKKKLLMSFRFSFLCQQGIRRAQLFVGSGVVHSALKRLIPVWWKY